MKPVKKRKDSFKEQMAEIEADFNRKREALFILYPEFKNSETDVPPRERGQLTNLVRQIFKKNDQPLTLDETNRELIKINPMIAKTVSKITLSNTLTILLKKEELEKVPESSPASYRRIKGAVV